MSWDVDDELLEGCQLNFPCYFVSHISAIKSGSAYACVQKFFRLVSRKRCTHNRCVLASERHSPRDAREDAAAHLDVSQEQS